MQRFLNRRASVATDSVCSSARPASAVTRCLAPYGGVAEWLKAPVLKTGSPQGLGGSNPSPSAFDFTKLLISTGSYSAPPALALPRSAPLRPPVVEPPRWRWPLDGRGAVVEGPPADACGRSAEACGHDGGRVMVIAVGDRQMSVVPRLDPRRVLTDVFGYAGFPSRPGEDHRRPSSPAATASASCRPAQGSRSPSRSRRASSPAPSWS